MQRLRVYLVLAVLAFIVAVSVAPASAQSGSVTVGVNANFLHGIDILVIRSIEFGSTVIGPGPGNVALNEKTGNISVGGSAISAPDDGTFHPAEIRFTAPVQGNVSIFAPSPNVFLTGDTHGRQVRFAPSASVTTVEITAINQTESVLIGGTINFPQDTPADSYTGSFVITVNYVS